ncbi:hypothetical protein PWT90_08153 [Aphanocladium album]|nr:hypothetical protein PWT90_08153 [Aphanocladium album]
MVVGRPASTVDLPPVKIRTVRFQLPGWNRLRLREALLLKKGLTAMRSASSRGDRNAGAGLAYVARAQMLANAPITFQATPAALEKHKNAIDAIDSTIASKYPEALTADGALAEALEHIYGNLARSGVEVPIELGFRFQPPRIIDQVQQAGYSGADQLTSSADESEEQTGYVPDLETITQKRLSEDYIHAEDTLETDRANNRAFDY